MTRRRPGGRKAGRTARGADGSRAEGGVRPRTPRPAGRRALGVGAVTSRPGRRSRRGPRPPGLPGLAQSGRNRGSTGGAARRRRERGSPEEADPEGDDAPPPSGKGPESPDVAGSRRRGGPRSATQGTGLARMRTAGIRRAAIGTTAVGANAGSSRPRAGEGEGRWSEAPRRRLRLRRESSPSAARGFRRRSRAGLGRTEELGRDGRPLGGGVMRTRSCEGEARCEGTAGHEAGQAGAAGPRAGRGADPGVQAGSEMWGRGEPQATRRGAGSGRASGGRGVGLASAERARGSSRRCGGEAFHVKPVVRLGGAAGPSAPLPLVGPAPDR